MISAPTDPAVTREDPLAGGAEVSTGGAVSLGELGTSLVEDGTSLELGLLETGVDDSLDTGGTTTVGVSEGATDGRGTGGTVEGTSVVDTGGAGVLGAGGRTVGGVGLII